MSGLAAALRGWLARRSGRDLALDGFFLALALAAAALPLVLGFDSKIANVILLVGIYVLLALGLNIVVGYTGLLDLGYVMFLASGAVLASLLMLLTKTEAGWVLPVGQTGVPEGARPFCGEGGFLPIMLICGLFCAGLGALRGIPTLKLTGDYYAIVTLGLAEIVFLVMFNEEWLTGGAFGIKIPKGCRPRLLGGELYYDTPQFYYLVLVAVLAGAVVSWRLQNSRLGRAWAAIRLDETAAMTCGINVASHKLIAFAVSGFFGGAGGALYALWSGTVAVRSLEVWQSFLILCCVVLGGMGSIRGVVLGAAVLISLGELLREDFVKGPLAGLFGLLGIGGRDPSVARFLIYGVLLIVIMRFRPQGLLPARRGGRPPAQDEERAMRQAGSELFAIGPGPAGPEGKAPEPSAPAVLALRGVTRDFGGLRAVDGLDLEVRRGTITSLIGPNGAGKTTVFNLVNGILPASAGSIRFRPERGAEAELAGRRPDLIAALGIARTFQNIRLFPDLPALDNVKLGLHRRTSAGLWAALLGGPRAARQEREITNAALRYLDFVGLLAKAQGTAGGLAYGEQRRLEIARALAGDPALLLLDEPAAGMNPQETGQLMELIRRIRDRGVTVLVIEHDMRLVMEISDQVYVLDYGEKIAEGPPAAVRNAPAVIEAYLGVRGGDLGARPAPPAGLGAG